MKVLLFSSTLTTIDRAANSLSSSEYEMAVTTTISEIILSAETGQASAVLIDMAHAEAKELLRTLSERGCLTKVALMVISKSYDQDADFLFAHTFPFKGWVISNIFVPRELPLLLKRAIASL